MGGRFPTGPVLAHPVGVIRYVIRNRRPRGRGESTSQSTLTVHPSGGVPG